MHRYSELPAFTYLDGGLSVEDMPAKKSLAPWTAVGLWGWRIVEKVQNQMDKQEKSPATADAAAGKFAWEETKHRPRNRKPTPKEPERSAGTQPHEAVGIW